MPEIIRLPAQPIPKIETAHYAPKNLGDHLLAFLNANNPRGFSENEATLEEKITNFVSNFNNNKEITLDLFYSVVDELGEFLQNLGVNVGKNNKQVKYLLARNLGYYNVKQMVRRNELILPNGEIDKDKRFPNLNFGKTTIAPQAKTPYIKTVLELKSFIKKIDHTKPVRHFDFSTIQGFLIWHSTFETVTLEQFKTTATAIKRLPGMTLERNVILDLLANCFGHNNFREGVEYGKVRNFDTFINLNKKEENYYGRKQETEKEVSSA